MCASSPTGVSTELEVLILTQWKQEGFYFYVICRLMSSGHLGS